MKIYTFEQGSEEWFSARLAKFTASTAQAIATAGKGLETLVYKKLAEKLTNKAPEAYSNEDIERGHELEAMARDAYELETGNIVEQVGFCELNEYVGASPDGLVKDGLVEIKCKNDVNFIKERLSDEIESAHRWQMQMQMYVTDRKWCDYVVFNPNFEKSLVIKRLKRDEEAIKKIKLGLDKGIKMFKDLLKKL